MSDAASTTPHRERGIRARRQREAQRVHAVIAGVERKIPTYELLGEEGLARIEAAADLILEEAGGQLVEAAGAALHYNQSETRHGVLFGASTKVIGSFVAAARLATGGHLA